jgi:hypothetical protein
VRVEHERRNTQRKYREPKVDEVRYPDRYRGVEQDEEVTHAHVDRWPCKAGVKYAEGYPCRGEPSARSDVSCASECEIAQDGIGIYLGRENFEYGRKRKEMFAKSKQGLARSSFHEFYNQ